MSSREGVLTVDWGLLLALICKRSRLSLPVMSRRLGVDRVALEAILAGDDNDPRWSTALRLLNAAADWLAAEEWDLVRTAVQVEGASAAVATAAEAGTQH